MTIREVSRCKAFDGLLLKYAHDSQALGCEMRFNIYLPPCVVANGIDSESAGNRVPLLYFLSGLTCTEDNFMQKAGALPSAAREQLAICTPDTSPRGLNITGDSDNWDFGVGAGFYLDATREPWNRNYKMYTYITKELPAVLKGSIGHVVDTERASVCGHSMGGHGALTIYLKNPQLYRSVSAFAPICHPSQCPWGRKAFSGYLSDESQWAQYDATELLKGSQQQWSAEVLIDQGTEDVFHKRDQQLLPQDFLQAAKSAQLKVCYREQEGYDHGYYFISTFIDDHIRHHSKALK